MESNKWTTTPGIANSDHSALCASRLLSPTSGNDPLFEVLQSPHSHPRVVGDIGDRMPLRRGGAQDALRGRLIGLLQRLVKILLRDLAELLPADYPISAVAMRGKAELLYSMSFSAFDPT